MTSILIKNGHVIDPVNKRDGVFDIFIESGKIIKVSKNIKEKAKEIIDAKGSIVVPGLIDMHVHLREPGRPCDNQATTRFILNEAKRNALINVYPIGSITKGREGKELAEIAELKENGCVGLSDDGDSICDSGLMRRALEYASAFDITVISHCEDKTLCGNGVMNEGFIATTLGLKGMPHKAESIIIERDIELAELANAKIHIAHVSTKRSVSIIRDAKKKGIMVTAEVTPHHIALIDACCKTYDTNTKVNPPLRTQEDIAALKEGLKDGTIDVIASDHAPHLESEKDVEFDKAPFGMIGLETSCAVAIMELIQTKVLTWPQLIEKMSVNPAKILSLDRGSLREGATADVAIIAPKQKWTYSMDMIHSKSKNTPFINWQFNGCVTDVIANGKIIMRNRKLG